MNKLNLKVKINDITHTFNTPEEFETWAIKELQQWDWLQNIQAPHPKSPNFIVQQNYIRFKQQLDPLINNLKQYLDSPQQLENCKKSIINLLTNPNQHNQIIFSQSKIGLISQEIAIKDSTVATGFLAYFIVQKSTHLPIITLGSFDGSVIGSLIENKEYLTIDNKPEQMGNLLKSWDKTLDNLGEKYKSELDTLSNTNDDLIKQISKLKQTNEKNNKLQASTIETLINDTTSKLEDLTEVYNEKLSLQSSVRYWKNQTKRYNLSCWIYGICSIISAILTVFLFWYFSSKYLNVTFSKLVIWHLSIVIASSLFCIWITKTLVHMYTSNDYLKTDANERVTMINTYLALLRSKTDAIDKEHKTIILNTLFRPSTGAMLKEDNPATTIEAITKLLKTAPKIS
ncbi:MAG: hypothetical protein COB02_18010 [Candidatus Cloacimonadota bacterium]|nr:MAG: hypothetical protein COB02_18010 [Candidatus Cloacimonadota bacterium]